MKWEAAEKMCKPPGLRNGLFLNKHLTQFPFYGSRGNGGGDYAEIQMVVLSRTVVQVRA